MADFEGNKFIGIDDDAYYGLSYRFLDTLFAHRVYNNQRYLEKNGAKFCWNPRNHKCASYRWTTVFCTLYHVRPGLDSLRIDITGAVDDDEGAGTASVDVRAEIIGLSEQQEATISDSGGLLTHQTLTLSEIDKVSRPTWGVLRIQVKSALGAEIEKGTDADNISSGALYWEATASVVDDTVAAVDLDQEDVVLDILGDHPAHAGSPVYMIDQPMGKRSTNLIGASATGRTADYSMSPHYLSWIQISSVSFEETYDRRLANINTDALKPLTPIDAAYSSYLLAANTQQLGRWERPLSVGYEGKDRADSSTDDWPAYAPEMWMYARGDSTTTILEGATVGLAHKDTTLRVAFLVGCFHFDPLYKATGITFEEMTQQAGTADWTFDATVSQMQSGTATPVSLATDSVSIDSIDMHPVETTATFMLPYQISQIGIDAAGGASTNWPSYIEHLYREGQLWDSDWAFLTTRVTLDVDLDLSSMARPVTLTVSVDASLDSANYERPNNQSTDNVILVGTALSLWEVPA